MIKDMRIDAHSTKREIVRTLYSVEERVPSRPHPDPWVKLLSDRRFPEPPSKRRLIDAGDEFIRAEQLTWTARTCLNNSKLNGNDEVPAEVMLWLVGSYGSAARSYMSAAETCREFLASPRPGIGKTWRQRLLDAARLSEERSRICGEVESALLAALAERSRDPDWIKSVADGLAETWLER